MTSLRSNLQLAVLFFVGLAAGIWTVAAPWIISYPTPNGAWTSSVWAATWVGSIVAVASGLGLVVALAVAVSDASRPQKAVAPTQPPETR